MEWLFAHMEDPGLCIVYTELGNPLTSGYLRAYTDIDAPIQPQSGGSGGPEPSAEQVSMLADMGFTPAQARKALRETVRSFAL